MAMLLLLSLISGATAVAYNYFPFSACHRNTAVLLQRWDSVITGGGRRISSHRLYLGCQKYGTVVGSKTDLSYQHFISAVPTVSCCRGNNMLHTLMELEILRAQHLSFRVSLDILNTGGYCG